MSSMIYPSQKIAELIAEIAQLKALRECPVQTAWDYGNHAMHEGAGFWIELTMKDTGETLRGPCYAPKDGKIVVQNYGPVTPNDLEPYKEIIINCADVERAEVEW